MTRIGKWLRWVRYEFWDDGPLSRVMLFVMVVFAAAVGWMLLTIADVVTGTSVVEPGTVVGRAYSPSSTSTGVAVGPKGQTSTVITTTAESYSVIVSVGGVVVSAGASPEKWAIVEEKQSVNVRHRAGGFMGGKYNYRVE